MKKYMSVLALAVAAGVGYAQDTGKEVVDKLLAHYNAVKGASVTMSMEIKVDDPALAAMMGDMDQSAQGVAIKPNRFTFWPEDKADGPMGGMPAPWVYSDGKTMTSAVPEMAMYEQKPAPESFAAMAAATDPEAAMPGGAWQLVTGADVIIELMGYAPRPEAEPAPEGEAEAEEGPGMLMEMLGDAEYKGKAGEGADAHHVLLITDETPTGKMSFEIHVAAEGEPWLVALKPLMDEEQGLGGMSMVMRFKDWKKTQDLPEASKFQPAEDWEKVDDLMDAIMTKMMGGGAPDAQPDPDEAQPGDAEDAAPVDAPEAGDPAPNFTLQTLGGESFTLADQMGKVVVLDFWATWCGPCVASLPSITSVTKDFESKGVVFAALNIAEEPEKIQGFMDKQKWDFRVALDADSRVANSYGVQFIPHTVVIDKKGVVRHVHVGLSPEEAKTQLRAELDALVKE